MSLSVAERQARYKQRRRAGRTLFRIKVDEDSVIEALIKTNLISEKSSRFKTEVERVLSELITRWASTIR